MKRSGLVSTIAVVAMSLAISGPSLAGGGETADTSGGTPVVTPPQSVDIDFNPHHHCEAVADDGHGHASTVWDLWRCAMEYIDPSFSCTVALDEPLGLRPPIPPPCLAREDYTVTWLTASEKNLYNTTPLPIVKNSVGVKILHNDNDNNNSEPYQLRLKETSTSINWTKVKVNRPYLAARIGLFVDDASHSPGTIEVRINGHLTTSIQTQDLTALNINIALQDALINAGCGVVWETIELADGSLSEYLSILHNPYGSTATTFEIKVTDRAIKTSEIWLDPDWRLIPDSQELPL